jgi:hypothetical protein
MDTVVAAPIASGDFAADVAAFSAYWRDAPASRPRATRATPSCAGTPARSTTS